MLLLWALGLSMLLFLWLFSLPILMIGVACLVPFCIVFAPISFAITLVVYYCVRPTNESSLREVLSAAPMEYWFGKIDVNIPDGNYLICCHPHGVICTVALFGIHFQPKSKTLVAVAPLLFAVPIVGWVAKHLGAIPATYKEITNALEYTSVILMPGGVPEIVTYERQLPYTHRWGFLKCARDTKRRILRIQSSTRYYDTVSLPLYEVRLFIAKRYNVPVVFPWVFGWRGTWIPKPLNICPNVKMFQYDISATLEQNRRAYYEVPP